LLSSPGDYKWLNDELKERNSVKMLEFESGHLGLVFPEDRRETDSIMRAILEKY